LRAFVVGADVVGGGGQVAVQEIEQLGQAGGLGGAHLLRQRRQRLGAEEQGAVGLGQLLVRGQLELGVVVELGGEGAGVNGCRQG